MKRDLETIRNILSNISAYENIEVTEKEAYHLSELIDQGLVNAIEILADGKAKYYYGLSLSWEGHELLTYISNDTVWNSIKQILNKNNFTVNEVPIEVIKKLSEKVMLSMLK